MQIRQEAGLEDPEIKHERSVHTALHISLSCEDLTVVRELVTAAGYGGDARVVESVPLAICTG